MTPEDFFVSVDSEGKVALNCPLRGCAWWYWWDMYPSVWTLTREARDHIVLEHT